MNKQQNTPKDIHKNSTLVTYLKKGGCICRKHSTPIALWIVALLAIFSSAVQCRHENFDLPKKPTPSEPTVTDPNPQHLEIIVPPKDSLLVAIDKGGTTPPPIDASGVEALQPGDTTLIDPAGLVIQGKALKAPVVSSQPEPLTPQETPVFVAGPPVSPNVGSAPTQNLSNQNDAPQPTSETPPLVVPEPSKANVDPIPTEDNGQGGGDDPDTQGLPAADGPKYDPSEEEHIEPETEVKKKSAKKVTINRKAVSLDDQGQLQVPASEDSDGIPGLEVLNIKLSTTTKSKALNLIINSGINIRGECVLLKRKGRPTFTPIASDLKVGARESRICVQFFFLKKKYEGYDYFINYGEQSIKVGDGLLLLLGKFGDKRTRNLPSFTVHVKKGEELVKTITVSLPTLSFSRAFS